MQTANKTVKALTPEGDAKKRLREAVSNRGRAPYNIWHVYGPKANRSWALPSDLALDCFIYIESNPLIIRYELEPDAVVINVGDENHKTTFDARLYNEDGTVDYAEFKYQAELDDENAVRTVQQKEAQVEWASRTNSRRIEITDKTLLPYRQRLMNWKRILPPLVRARNTNIDCTVTDVAARLIAAKCLSIGQLLVSLPVATNPHVFAALFRLLQTNRCHADLDACPISGATVFTARGVA
jgi:hypothetical protein